MTPESRSAATHAFDAFVNAPLFAGAPEPLLRSMLAGCETLDLAPGERLLTAGAANDALYIVLAGSLGVHVPGTGQAHLSVGRGDCVGELSLIDGLQVSADVIAEAATTVAVVDREQLWRLIDATSQVARNLLRILAGRVRHDDRVLGERERLQRHHEEAAMVDPLTGLRNRRWLDVAFARQLDRTTRSGLPLSVLMIDVDHFKRVNDEHGHLAGDGVLVHVGRTLASCLRPQDLLARFGGEEFAVLLPGVGAETAMVVAERLRATVARTAPPIEDPTRVQLRAITVSIGVATADARESATVPHLIERADRALYRAKHSGRNRVCA